MNVLLWVLQFLLAVYFGFTGVMPFVVSPGLPAPMAWMYELPGSLHLLSGTAEILAALGLILPGLTHIAPRLTPLAALGWCWSWPVRWSGTSDAARRQAS